MTIRVRFAPSPTGSLHVGGVRTALFNWLFARQVGGQFVLRIEDTDIARNTEDSYAGIIDSLNWLGLNWDEGPVKQSDRLSIYKNYAEQLIAQGKAYRCDCSPEVLSQLREAHNSKNKNMWSYPGICRDKNISNEVPHVIRFNSWSVPQSVSYNDLVFGNISSINTWHDFVLIRENGLPLYNFACVVDDHDMGITLVCRGRDHMINTPPQISLYEAFGWSTPQFAHLPMLLNMSGEKLAKRDGAVSVQSFRDLGFSANGLINYLMRFGWSHGDQELFSVDELIKLFSWKACKKADGKFDIEKATAINAKNLMSDKLVGDSKYWEDLKQFSEKVELSSIKLVRQKAKSYLEAARMLDFLNDGSLQMGQEMRSRVSNLSHFSLARDALINTEWSRTNILSTIKNLCQNHNISFAVHSQEWRFILTQKKVGPDIYDILEYLGKEKILRILEFICQQ